MYAFCYLTLYKLRDSFFVMCSPRTTLLREVRVCLEVKWTFLFSTSTFGVFCMIYLSLYLC